MRKKLPPFLLILLLWACYAPVQNDPAQTELIYGHKDGMALTMFLTKPKAESNHRAILYLASGGYFSSVDWVADLTKKSDVYLKRGYTVFIVTHSSAPVYTSVEVIPDIQRAVQFVRYNAAKFEIDPDKIGITGSSSGANLALLSATTQAQVATSKDPIAKVSSKVNAVACFFPPTDFLNYHRPDNPSFKDSTVQRMVREQWIESAFMFKRLNPKNNTYEQISDTNQLIVEYKKLSPIYFVDKTSAPTLIYHGDKDVLVPIYQSEMFIQKLKSVGVACKLVVKKGGAHGWEDDENEIRSFADWFDLYLK